jgi:hypothetical protein
MGHRPDERRPQGLVTPKEGFPKGAHAVAYWQDNQTAGRPLLLQIEFHRGLASKKFTRQFDLDLSTGTLAQRFNRIAELAQDVVRSAEKPIGVP